MKNIPRAKPILIVLALVLSAAFAAACTGPKANPESPTQSPGENGQDGGGIAEPTTQDPLSIYDHDLGEYDFGGEEFKIQIFENAAVRNNIDTPEQNGDMFNDALYKRNRTVEAKFNVKIKEVVIGDFKNDQTRKVILTGDSTVFDMFDSRCPDVFINWVGGLTIPYDDLPVIDLAKPYWNISANKTLTIGGNQYAAIGKFNISSYDISHALLFNKKLINDFMLENPYTLVNEGKWTFDRMEEMMKAVIQDLNGDGIMDLKDDRFGYLTNPKQVLANFWISAGEFSVNKDEDDMPYVAIGGEKFLTVCDRVYSMLWDTGAFAFVEVEQDIPPYAIEMFGNNQTLFLDTTLLLIESMRSMEMDFGIIPYPKWNEQQENYVSRVEYYMVQQVPITNADPERAGVMLEALNSESAKTIFPAFFETALKTKYARDDESAEMLDLILNTLVIDIGDTTMAHLIRDGFMARMFATKDRNIVSKLAGAEGSFKSFLRDVQKKLPGV